MILKREEEIRKFVPKEYYSIEISTKKGSSNFKMNWVDKNNSTTSFNEEKIENIAKKLDNKEIKILNEYLPKQLTQEELEQKIKEIIAEVGATSIKDIGVVMKTAKEKIGATADGKAINETAKKILG